MAKKSKKSSKKASSNPADGLRDAVERTWAGASGASTGTQRRVQEVFDDFGSALVRLRETLDEKRVLDTLEALRDEVVGLGRRVANLEGRGGAATASSSASRKPAAKRKASARKTSARKTSARKTSARKTSARKTAARKSAAKPVARKTAARKSAAKPAARKTAAKRKPATRKTAAKRKPAAKPSASSGGSGS